MCPAEPILASTLLNDEDLDDLLEGLIDASAKKRIELGRRESTLGTGVREVDDVLSGGLRAGRMVGVSGEGGEVSRLSMSSCLCYCGFTDSELCGPWVLFRFTPSYGSSLFPLVLYCFAPFVFYHNTVTTVQYLHFMLSSVSHVSFQSS